MSFCFPSCVPHVLSPVSVHPASTLPDSLQLTISAKRITGEIHKLIPKPFRKYKMFTDKIVAAVTHSKNNFLCNLIFCDHFRRDGSSGV